MEFNPSSNFHHTHHQTHPYHSPPFPPTSNLPFYPYPPPNQHQTFLNNPHFSQYDQHLIDEVIYLHTLWQRGPPTPFHHPPYFGPKPSPSTPIFKKKAKRNKKLRNTHVGSGKEWPVGPIPTCPSPPGSGWAPFPPAPAPVRARPVSGEEVARVSSLKVQLKGLDSCIGLFGKKSDDSDDDDDDDDEEEEYGGDCDEEVELMGKVFEGNEELRGYYERKCWDGEFYCLVCGVIGGKFGRKYRNCLALVQHSVSILRTKRKRVHRGYAYVVCRVLGWDINRLPSMPPSNCDGVDKSSCEGEANKHGDSCDGDVEPNLDKANNVDLGSVCPTDEGHDSDKLVRSENEKNNNGDGSQEETHNNSSKRDGVCTIIEQPNPLFDIPIDGADDDDVKQNREDVESGVIEPGANVEAH